MMMIYLNPLSISSLVVLLLAYLSNVYINDCFNAALALAPAVLLIDISHRAITLHYLTLHYMTLYNIILYDLLII